MRVADTRHAHAVKYTRVNTDQNPLHSQRLYTIHKHDGPAAICIIVHSALISSLDSCRAAAGFLETGGGGARLLGPFKTFLSLPWLGEIPEGFGDSGSSFFLRVAAVGLVGKGIASKPTSSYVHFAMLSSALAVCYDWVIGHTCLDLLQPSSGLANSLQCQG